MALSDECYSVGEGCFGAEAAGFCYDGAVVGEAGLDGAPGDAGG